MPKLTLSEALKALEHQLTGFQADMDVYLEHLKAEDRQDPNVELAKQELTACHDKLQAIVNSKLEENA